MFKVGDDVIWISEQTTFVGGDVAYTLVPKELYMIALCSGGIFFHLHHRSWPRGIYSTGYARDKIAHACFCLYEID